MVRLRLDLAYDGAGFAGWACQPSKRTVQGVVEAALGTALRLPDPPRTVCAGRTDAGVHARGQVAHVDVPADALTALGLTRLAGSMRGLLPLDVAMIDVSLAAPHFDARFCATSRRYMYSVADSRTNPDPLRRASRLELRGVLRVPLMNEAALPLIGSHDFAAFCRRRPGASTVRTLLLLECRRTDDGVVEMTVEADAFCHSMVRSLAGALVRVGAGRRSVEWTAQVLGGGVRPPGLRVLPAHALVLEGVRYPLPFEYGDQAARARAVRKLCE